MAENTDYNSINPYLYHMYTNNNRDRYLFTNAQREEVHYNALLKSARPNRFKAIVLSGYRTETNTGAGTDASDAALVPSSDGKRYLELTIYPIDEWYGLQIPNPLLADNKKKIKAIIALCTSLCRVRSKFPVDANQSPLSFGQIIDIERETARASESYGGMRWSYPEGLPQRVPEFDQLFGLTSNQSSLSNLFSGQSLLMNSYFPIANQIPLSPGEKHNPTNPDQFPGSILPIVFGVTTFCVFRNEDRATYGDPNREPRVTSRMGTRNNPFGGAGTEKHGGIDISAAIGVPMYAIYDGEVLYARGTTIGGAAVSGFGAWLVIRHRNIKRNDGTTSDLYSLYGHINGSMVKAGDSVTQGQPICSVGNEGRSSGPHLHFELCTNFYKRSTTKLDPIYSLGWSI